MKAGIQPNTVATDKHARFLDKSMKSISKNSKFQEEIYSLIGYTFERKLPKKVLLEHGIFEGCEPDGGVWFKDGVPMVALEGKKQGKPGNAIERCADNNATLKYFNPDIKSVHLGIGEGFEDLSGNPYKVALSHLHLDGADKDFNVLYDSGHSWFIKPTGFSYEEIETLMRDSIVNTGCSFTPTPKIAKRMIENVSSNTLANFL